MCSEVSRTSRVLLIILGIFLTHHSTKTSWPTISSPITTTARIQTMTTTRILTTLDHPIMECIHGEDKFTRLQLAGDRSQQRTICVQHHYLIFLLFFLLLGAQQVQQHQLCLFNSWNMERKPLSPILIGVSKLKLTWTHSVS